MLSLLQPFFNYTCLFIHDDVPLPLMSRLRAGSACVQTESRACVTELQNFKSDTRVRARGVGRFEKNKSDTGPCTRVQTKRQNINKYTG